jgi:hypothetical protein
MLINEYKVSTQRLLDPLKTILSNYFDLYDLMIGTKVLSFEEIKNASMNHIKAYDDILKLIRCDELTERVFLNKLV